MRFRQLAKDPVLVFGLVISWTSSITMLISGHDNLLSFSVGVGGSALTLLVDILLSVKAYQENLLEVAGFSRHLQEDPWLYEAIREIARSCETIRAKFDTRIFADALVEAVEQCRIELQKLSRGHLELPAGQDAELALTLIQTAESYGKATSLVDAVGWWETAVGQRYFEANVEAVTRGVQITRLFIIPRGDLDKIEQQVRKHMAAGIRVYIAFEDEVPLELLEDYALWDGKVVLRGEPTRAGQIRRSLITVDEWEVRETEHDFSKLLAQAHLASSLLSPD